jgi:hypothetical protein
MALDGEGVLPSCLSVDFPSPSLEAMDLESQRSALIPEDAYVGRPETTPRPGPDMISTSTYVCTPRNRLPSRA